MTSTALLLLLAGGIALALTLSHYDVSLRQLLVKVAERADLHQGWVATLLTPPDRYSDQPLDGRLRGQHPRILLPELAEWDGRGLPAVMQQRLALYKSQGIAVDDYPPCQGDSPLRHAVCWVSTGNERAGENGIDRLPSARLELPSASGEYGNAWELALAYDLLSLHPRMTPQVRDQVEQTLASRLRDYLVLLDGDSASLWHGRSSLAAQAWLSAVVLTPGLRDHDELIRRAQAHFRQTVQALRLTEAWPEGYNYWINTRAFVLTLAAASYLNGLDDAQYAETVRNALERVGLWTIYTTRPDNRVEGLGDEGPRTDLKDETRRVIDLIAQLTRKPVFATYSRYLEALHGRESYYRGYRWGFRLLNDPTVEPLPGIKAGTLTGLDDWLPRTELFGRGAMNLFIARSGWGPTDTMITLRAGGTFTHHGHYDAGHFTLFKGAPLAITNATYSGSITAPHRLHYGMRTISKNSLLILRPGEEIKPSRLMQRNIIDGGQRIVMPTGSAVRSVEHWLANLHRNKHVEGGAVTGLQTEPNTFAFISTDLTDAYDNARYDSQGRGGKVKRITRELLYLFDEDRVLIHDQVAATDPAFVQKWLLHTLDRPNLANALPFVGTADAGILQSDADRFSVTHGQGRVDVARILPEQAIIRLVGGKGYEYYVETDADETLFDGHNFAEGATEKHWFDLGKWRVEIQPRQQAPVQHFLVAMSPSIGLDRSDEVSALPVGNDNGYGLATPRSLVLFPSPDEHGSYPMKMPARQARLLIVGVVAGTTIELSVAGQSAVHRVRETGIMELYLPPDTEPDTDVVLTF